jgi:hypothetical protein
MKYEITYKNSKNEAEKEIVDAKFVQVLNGNLYLMADMSVDIRVHAIFSSWIKIVEVEE